MGTLRCVACQICEKECPPAVHLHREEQGQEAGRQRQDADLPGGLRHRHLGLHELPDLRRGLPVRRDQDGPGLRDRDADRFNGLLLDREQLAKPNSYFTAIHPTEAAEVDARLAAERKAAEEKAKAAAAKAPQSRAPAGATARKPPGEPKPPPRMTAPPRSRIGFSGAAPPMLRDGFTGFPPEPGAGWVNSLIAMVAHPGGLRPALRLPDPRRAQDPRPGPEPPRPQPDGPFGLLQPFADGIKMLTKEDIVPRAADPVLHFLAPVALLAFSLLTFAVIPYGRHLVPVDWMPASSISSRPERRRSWRSSWRAGRATTSTRSSPRCAPWRS
jgi:hypothetical protein